MKNYLKDSAQQTSLPDNWIERVKEIRKAQNFKEAYSHYFSRHFSFIITASLSYTSITPHQITISMIPIGIIGFGFLCFGTPSSFLIGGLLFTLLNIADAVDGELARYKNVTSIAGDYLDRVAHYFTNSLAILGTGIGLFIQYDLTWILIFACLIEVVYTFDEVARDLLVTCGLQSIESQGSNRKELKSISKIKIPTKIKKILELTATNLAFFHLLVVFSLLDILFVLHFKYSPNEVFFVANFALFFSVATIAKALVRTRKIHNSFFKAS